MVKHLSFRDLSGKQRKRWADARKQAYRKVLRDPGASPAQKSEARRKIADATVSRPSR